MMTDIYSSYAGVEPPSVPVEEPNNIPNPGNLPPLEPPRKETPEKV